MQRSENFCAKCETCNGKKGQQLIFGAHKKRNSKKENKKHFFCLLQRDPGCFFHDFWQSSGVKQITKGNLTIECTRSWRNPKEIKAHNRHQHTKLSGFLCWLDFFCFPSQDSNFRFSDEKNILFEVNQTEKSLIYFKNVKLQHIHLHASLRGGLCHCSAYFVQVFVVVVRILNAKWKIQYQLMFVILFLLCLCVL